MKYNLLKTVAVIASSTCILFLSACGGSSGSGTSVQPGNSGNLGSSTIVANDFSFPEVSEANGTMNVMIPPGPMPTFSARRTLSNGGGNTIVFGDPVVLKYNMYRWSNGEMVESTDQFDEPITIRAGVTEGIPAYLTNSLLGRKIGDRLEIVFEAGMDDLPEYLDGSDAYVLVVDLI